MKKNILSFLLFALSAIGALAQEFNEVFLENRYYIEQHNILETRDGHLILNCPVLDPVTFQDIGQYLYKVTLEGELVDSLFISNTSLYKHLLERNPFDDNSYIMASTARSETDSTFLLKIRYIDDDLNIFDEKTVRLNDNAPETGIESLFLDVNNDIILHYKLGDGKRFRLFLARMSVDGTLKDNVMYHEVDSENTFYWRYHHVGIYNVSPLEYCIWAQEYQVPTPFQGTKGNFWTNLMVVDSNFNLLSSRLLDDIYPPDAEVVYCDDDHYMLSSYYHPHGVNPQRGIIAARFTKDDEIVNKAIFVSPDQPYGMPFINKLERGKNGGWYYSYSTTADGDQVSIARLDDELRVVWERYCLSDNGVFHWPFSMRTLENGGVAVGGWDSYNSPDDFRIFLIIVTDDGWTTPEMEAYVKPYCIYPNPTKDFVTLQVSPDTQFVKAELYDTSGRLLLTAESDVTQIGISHLPQGQYVLKLYDANGKTWSDKVVKE